MNISDLTAKAEALRAMHAQSEPLVLPNAWDAATAVLVAEVGFSAVATTSAGVAWALGRPDGQVVSRDDMLDAVARKMIDPAKFVWVVVGDKAQVLPQIQSLGLPISVVDASAAAAEKAGK